MSHQPSLKTSGIAPGHRVGESLGKTQNVSSDLFVIHRLGRGFSSTTSAITVPIDRDLRNRTRVVYRDWRRNMERQEARAFTLSYLFRAVAHKVQP